MPEQAKHNNKVWTGMHDSQAAAKPGGIAAVSEGVVLYELDDEPLAESKPRQPGSASRIGFPVLGNFDSFSTLAWKAHVENPSVFCITPARLCNAAAGADNYSPPHHRLTFLRALAEDQDRRSSEAWPREQQRHRAWFSTLNEAYVKARSSRHYLITEEALALVGRADGGGPRMC
jgi:hypothetical protein